ncbi:MAG: TIGR00730 family Rossman fold protein [Deltaproteobacteria bacterium]|nr:TIGR00730 family Rossman fold protein [Deltaproteobacteria bacterium]
MKSVCVFCGANAGKNPIYLKSAKDLGQILSQKDISLVYGGSSVGLMGAVADGVLSEKGRAFGVIPKHLEEKEIAHKNLTKLYVVDSMHERKALMFDLSEGFITLPGGLGSLEETCEILTWAQLGLHKKPVGILNVNGFYDFFLKQLDLAVQEELMKPVHREMVIVDSDPQKLLKKMSAYQPPDLDKWIGRKQT